MEPRAILVAKKTFVFLVFVLPATILVIYGIDGLPSTPCIVGRVKVWFWLFSEVNTGY